MERDLAVDGHLFFQSDRLSVEYDSKIVCRPINRLRDSLVARRREHPQKRMTAPLTVLMARCVPLLEPVVENGRPRGRIERIFRFACRDGASENHTVVETTRFIHYHLACPVNHLRAETRRAIRRACARIHEQVSLDENHKAMPSEVIRCIECSTRVQDSPSARGSGVEIEMDAVDREVTIGRDIE